MRRALKSVVVLGALLSACPEPNAGKCARVTCASGEVCDEATGACVDLGAGGGGGSGGGGGAGGGTSSDAGADAGSPGADEYCPQLAQAKCARDSACGRLNAAQAQDCVRYELGRCADLLRRLDAGVRGFSPAAAAACLTSISGAPCFSAGALVPECFGVFPPNSPIGGLCEQGADCREGFCAVGAPGCSTCVAYGDAGSLCTSSLPCAPGLACPPGFEDGGTVGGGTRACTVIEAPAPPGAACDAFHPCDTSLGQCRTPSDGGVARCEALAVLGDPCDESTPCRGGTFCNENPGDGGAALCEATRPGGAVCAFAQQCADGFCNFGHLLDGGSRTCGALGEGLTCAAAADCTAGLYCRGLGTYDDGGFFPGTCTARLALGASCVNEQHDDGCASFGARCLDGQCRRAQYTLDAGAECAGPGQCLPSLYCPDAGAPPQKGRCAPRLSESAQCEGADWCADGLWCNPTRGVCTGYAGPAQSCGVRPCQDFLGCVPRDGGEVCVTLGAPPAACGLEAPCTFGAFCALDAGVCAAEQAGGATCTQNHECHSGACLGADGGAASGVCAAGCFP